MNTKIAVAAGMVAVLAAVFAMAPAALAADVNVDIVPGAQTKTTDAFAPNPVHVNVGDTVIWTNKDTTIHTATSGTSSSGATGMFGGNATAPQLIFAAGTQRFTFTAAGEYPYFCSLHPTMVGTVIVGGGSTGPQVSKVTATIGGNSYEISASSATSKATAAEIDPTQKVVTVTFDKAGDVTLTLPKTMISGISEQNGVKVVTENDTSTVVSITVPEGSTTTNIQGSFVVPEFPVVAALVLGVTIAAVISYARFGKGISAAFGRV